MRKAYLNSKKIGFIGAGNMTRSILGGLALQKDFDPSRYIVSNRSAQKLEDIKKTFNVETTEQNELVIEKSDWIVLSIKPQDVPEFLEENVKFFESDKVLLSLCAGLSYLDLKKRLPIVGDVVRLMPTTTCEIGQGVVGVYSENQVLVEDVAAYFESLGQVLPLDDEDLLNTVMVGAGSGVGFILELMQIWKEWLEERGLDSDDSRKLVTQVFGGTAALAEAALNKSLGNLQSEVTSKKGVTFAGLEAMRDAEIDRVLNLGFSSALKRNSELA